ncbi:MAG: hypothetical protein WDN04_04540 [Rhodospirillales bacterium]
MPRRRQAKFASASTVITISYQPDVAVSFQFVVADVPGASVCSTLRPV